MRTALNEHTNYDAQFTQTITNLKRFISDDEVNERRLYVIDTETESFKHHYFGAGEEVS